MKRYDPNLFWVVPRADLKPGGEFHGVGFSKSRAALQWMERSPAEAGSALSLETCLQRSGAMPGLSGSRMRAAPTGSETGPRGAPLWRQEALPPGLKWVVRKRAGGGGRPESAFQPRMPGVELAPARDPGSNVQTQKEIQDSPATWPHCLLLSTAAPGGGLYLVRKMPSLTAEGRALSRVCPLAPGGAGHSAKPAARTAVGLQSLHLHPAPTWAPQSPATPRAVPLHKRHWPRTATPWVLTWLFHSDFRAPRNLLGQLVPGIVGA